MSSGVYLMQEGAGLVEMRETPYDTERLLQELLAAHPSLLAGDQMNSADPRRWLLVSREMAVPAEQDGPGRWALDHLFVDQDGVPTLVEVKRSTDSRIRREVVGQMLDYAANAVTYWPVETIRARFQAQCERDGADPAQQFAALIGEDADGEAFWQAVKTNLQAGRIRLVFVADTIPPELQRIIEFLNAQMDPTEVLGVAIQQYAGQGQKVFVPRVVGLTAGAQQRKSTASPASPAGRQWDEGTFFEELARRRGPDETLAARRILEWARGRGLRVWWGKGRIHGSFFPLLDRNGRSHWLVSVWTGGSVEVQFSMMQEQPPFASEALRRELQTRLNRIQGVRIPDGSLTQRPPLRLTALVPGEALAQFLAVLDWVVDTMQHTDTTGPEERL